ncbi:FKBP-type peptidyl-prolyl cis-trans isomerase [Draconibacterium sp.]|nr:FKBP-type peptidyl-prolyl cis-trans isomerase [Draconibacterium sp.]
MKNSIIYLLAIVLVIAGTSCQQSSTKKVKLETEIDSVSYVIGNNIGENVIQQFPNIEPDIIAKAIKDVYNKQKETLFDTDQEAGMYVNEYLRKEVEIKGQKNLEEGNAFLEENKNSEGITTTGSGLQYEILNAGTGSKPTAMDTVRVHYQGTYIDETVFDSSFERGSPIVMVVGMNMIQGWTEVLQLMSVGSKWKVYIPAELAYGSNPDPRMGIEPNRTLIFEMELLEIVKHDSTESVK